MNIINLVFDFLVLLGGLALLLVGMRRGFIRSLLSTVALLLAIAFAGLIAPAIVGVFVTQAGAQSETPSGIVFAAVVIAIYAALEVLLRHNFPNTRIQRIGLLDNILGFVCAIPWALLALGLIVNCLGYVNFAVMGTEGSGFIGDWYTSSRIVAFVTAVLAAPIRAMLFLYPNGLPQPLAFFARG